MAGDNSSNELQPGTGARKHDASGRSTGTRKRQKHWKIAGQWAPRTIAMLESPAWRVTSLSVRRLLDRLEIELASHGGQDNGRLPCTYADFASYGIDRHAIAPAIREAVALGFIEYRQGAGGNSEFRQPNKFRLTYRPTDDAAPTDDWRKIETIDEAQALASAARKSASKSVSDRRRKN